MDKDRIVAILEEIGVLLELKGENPFKTRAYVTAARALEAFPGSVEQLVAEGRLGEIRGLGEALQKKVAELAQTGRLAYHDELKATFPEPLLELLRIPGVGPKKLKVLHEQLGIASLDQLEAACQAGRVAALSGFGEKTQARILQGIEFRRAHAARHLLSAGWVAADALLAAVRAHPDVIQCSVAGSVRRSSEVIGNVNVIASSRVPGAVLDWYVTEFGAAGVMARSGQAATVRLADGLESELWVVTDAEFPVALMHLTGSKAHNLELIHRAETRGLRLEERRLVRASSGTGDQDEPVVCRTEGEVYAELGLPYLAPELREARGELKAAEEDSLPRLLEWTELRGSLHNHSNWSDGRQTLEEIAAYMSELGCEYWGITDHSRSSFVAHGLDEARLRDQQRAVAALNDQHVREGNPFRLLMGSEVDILGDGRLDFPDEVLAGLDVVVASLHQGFAQSEADNTRRLIRAVENRYVHILGHMTGRLLLERAGYPVDATAVIDACGETGTWIELNANPYRFDLDWRLWPYAKSKGVKCVINCDAHRNEHAGFLRLGAGIARKGWLAREDVINTLPLPALQEALTRKRARC
jgi:DNA polymerase (family X)